jgi:hypothetical protein
MYKYGVRLAFSGNSFTLLVLKSGKVLQNFKEKEQIARCSCKPDFFFKNLK